MRDKTAFQYPREEYVQLFKDFYTGINGPNSFDPDLQVDDDNWCYNVFCSRGPVLEKAGFALLDIVGGTIYDAPGSLTLFETLIYPARPDVPGLIFVVTQNETDTMGKLIVYCIDLIIQDGRPHSKEKKMLSDAIEAFYAHENREIEERNAFSPGRLLAGAAADCGLVSYFEETDIPFLDRLIRAMLPVYKTIVEEAQAELPQEDDYTHMRTIRLRIADWITNEDVGVIIAKDNGIPFEIIKSYAFPPMAD
jgi:hypothetical protein